ncbi:MAG: hypothetical protein HC882_03300 [Acidobacteria bacterium]|nr:hypothetical protein [Acidobacteriota bacterium]
MSTSRTQWTRLVLAAWCAAAALVLPALAQDAPPENPPENPPETEEAPKVEGVIEKIERERESVITGEHFSYDSQGRRDPFESLVKAQPVAPGKRPKGVAGMVVTEIDLKGIATDTGGHRIALFRGSDNRGYSLREGDIVYDARLISIDVVSGSVVFRQEVDDPRRIKPYRDVIKRLVPVEETGGEGGAEGEDMEENS